MNSPHTIQKNLFYIGQFNHHLARELAKLPEIRLFKTSTARLALDNLLHLYQLAPDRFDEMFMEMNGIGMTEHRRFCAPLQALFWLIQDGRLAVSGLLLGIHVTGTNDTDGNKRPTPCSAQGTTTDDGATKESHPHYTLQKILDAAWNGESPSDLSQNIHHIIQRIRNKPEVAEYALLRKKHTNLQLQSWVMDDFLQKKDIFSSRDWATINRALEQSRWKLFYTVADRLNSPELISYYINKNFFFRKTPANGVYLTFFSKRAQCTDAAYFAEFMLTRAGYKTFIRSVKWDKDPWDGLHTGAGIVLDDGRYLLVSNYTGINAISGPFTSLEDLDRKLSCGKNIIGSKWGAYFPPRYY